MRTIGLDIGTTTISAVVADPVSGRIEHSYTVDNDSFVKDTEPWEKRQDPTKIIKKGKELLDSLLDAYDDVCRIGLTGQMHGIVYVDRDGNSVSDLYTWQEQSGEQMTDDGSSVCDRIRNRYGQPVYTGYGLVTHLYHRKQGIVPENAAKICTIADYLGMVLTGRRTPLVHAGNAAGMGFYSVDTGEFMLDILHSEGMDERILPAVTDFHEILGTYRHVPVMTAIGDNQASFRGSVKDVEHSVLVNMGTGGQVSVLADRCISRKGLEMRPYNKDKYLIAGSSLCGGRAYALLKDFFESYAQIAEMADIDHYAVMNIFLDQERDQSLWVETTFAGTRDDPEKKGRIENLSAENFTPGAVIYGVLEGMARELFEMYQCVDADIRKEKTVLVLSGNGLRKNVHLQRIMEEMFGMRAEIADNQEEAACGAALTEEETITKRRQNDGKEISD